MEYHLLTLVCHCLILSLAVLFLWSNASTFINKSPPNIPEVKIPEDAAVNVALTLRYEINRGFATLREIGHGRDLKKFLIVIAGLWLLSVLGSCCNFLTLSYIGNDRVSYIPQISPFIVDASYEWKLFCSLCSLHGAVHCPSTV
jgi:hypothetical protein